MVEEKFHTDPLQRIDYVIVMILLVAAFLLFYTFHIEPYWDLFEYMILAINIYLGKGPLDANGLTMPVLATRPRIGGVVQCGRTYTRAAVLVFARGAEQVARVDNVGPS